MLFFQSQFENWSIRRQQGALRYIVSAWVLGRGLLVALVWACTAAAWQGIGALPLQFAVAIMVCPLLAWPLGYGAWLWAEARYQQWAKTGQDSR